MTHNDYTKNILNIKDPNIYFSKNCLEERIINGKTNKVFHGILTYKPTHCPKCGVINNSHDDIIKWGFKHNCRVKLPQISKFKTILFLTKQRFFCNHCNSTFIASTSLVDSKKNISNNSHISVRLDLMNKISEKDIALSNDISHASVNRILDDISSKQVIRSYLPTVMNFDEFKATRDTTSRMAFIIVDNNSGNIFDILDSRKSIDIIKYFKRYQKYQRDKVKFIITDMYKPYINISKSLFKNAEIVIDRFHIVLQAYNALNITRVKLCTKNNLHYEKLKYYWKLILKNENDLNDNKKKYNKHFKKYLTEQEIVTYLINTDIKLKATYKIYQGIINSIKDKDIDKFHNIIHQRHENISPYMIKTLKTYREFEKYIVNSLKYTYNNGVVEGTNNLIKCLKRIAFGYKSFKHFKARIFLIKGVIKVKKIDQNS